jgi:CBS domain-containing protein
MSFRSVTSPLISGQSSTDYGGLKVSAMKPSPVVALLEDAPASDAAAYMSAKRQDAVLVTDAAGNLTGIVTDKDLAFR